MLIKIFTIRFSERIDGFDDEPVRRFMADKEIVSVKEEFFVRNGIPYWTAMLTYEPAVAAADAKEGKPDQKATDPRELLKEADIPLYNRLREWRKQKALEDSVPPYVIFHNKQVARIAAKKPRNLNQLSTIEGIGKAKLEKYGKDVYRVVIGLNSYMPDGYDETVGYRIPA